MSLPIVPFGNKYKGKPITEMLQDTAYVEYCKKQEWFKNYPTIYNIAVNQTITSDKSSSKTPEHNRLQNLFLDKKVQNKILFRNIGIDFDKINSSINALYADKEFIECFNPNKTLQLIMDDFKRDVKFEDKFNWDVNLYSNTYKSISLVSNIETEQKAKDSYKQQYDKENKEKIEKYIRVRQIIDEERIKKFEKDMKEYLEQDEDEVRKYELECKKYESRKKLFILSKEQEIMFELKIDLAEHDYIQQKKYSKSKYSHSELDNIRKQISDKLEIIMKEWDKTNIKPTGTEILKEPEKYDIHKEINIPAEYQEILKPTWSWSRLKSVSALKLDLEEYKSASEQKSTSYENSEYNRSLIESYKRHRIDYYVSLIKKYFDNFKKYDIEETENKKQFKITIDLISGIGNCLHCCELKPLLGDDYPEVLRKMSIQIDLTKSDKTIFDKYKKIWYLIIGNFSSSSASKEQLITIFKQKDINIIFENELIDTPVIYKIQNGPPKQIKDITSKDTQLKELSEKLGAAEQKIKELEKELNKLKSVKTEKPKSPKTITDYFVKN